MSEGNNEQPNHPGAEQIASASHDTDAEYAELNAYINDCLEQGDQPDRQRLARYRELTSGSQRRLRLPSSDVRGQSPSQILGLPQGPSDRCRSPEYRVSRSGSEAGSTDEPAGPPSSPDALAPRPVDEARPRCNFYVSSHGFYECAAGQALIRPGPPAVYDDVVYIPTDWPRSQYLIPNVRQDQPPPLIEEPIQYYPTHRAAVGALRRNQVPFPVVYITRRSAQRDGEDLRTFSVSDPSPNCPNFHPYRHTVTLRQARVGIYRPPGFRGNSQVPAVPTRATNAMLAFSQAISTALASSNQAPVASITSQTRSSSLEDLPGHLTRNFARLRTNLGGMTIATSEPRPASTSVISEISPATLSPRDTVEELPIGAGSTAPTDPVATMIQDMIGAPPPYQEPEFGLARSVSSAQPPPPPPPPPPGPPSGGSGGSGRGPTPTNSGGPTSPPPSGPALTSALPVAPVTNGPNSLVLFRPAGTVSEAARLLDIYWQGLTLRGEIAVTVQLQELYATLVFTAFRIPRDNALETRMKMDAEAYRRNHTWGAMTPMEVTQALMYTVIAAMAYTEPDERAGELYNFRQQAMKNAGFKIGQCSLRSWTSLFGYQEPAPAGFRLSPVERYVRAMDQGVSATMLESLIQAGTIALISGPFTNWYLCRCMQQLTFTAARYTVGVCATSISRSANAIWSRLPFQMSFTFVAAPTA